MRDPVRLTLLPIGMLALLALPLLTHAPNRLVTGSSIALAEIVSGGRILALAPALLFLAAWLPGASRLGRGLWWLGCAGTLTALTWLAGTHAAALEAQAAPLGRTSLGSGYWLSIMLCALASRQVLQRAGSDRVDIRLGVLAGLGLLAGPVALLWHGDLDALSLLKEYANRQDVFDAALHRHGLLVLATLVPTLLIGMPLGVWAQRRRSRQPASMAALLSVLNLIQTVPSIAMFALLMAPLAALAAAWPALARWGISGIGVAPAVIALTLYALLPMVRATMAGLDQVSAAAVEAAHGMGMSARQVFWQVEVPLALPVWLSGWRITTVQAIGLAVVAALIGAGGFGAVMFQGLLSSAVDLVLLGVAPVVALALLADAGFGVAASLLPATRAQARTREST